MRKRIMAMTILITMLLQGTAVFADTNIMQHQLTGETKQVVEIEKNENYLENVDFNGRYYPLQYWEGLTVEDARAESLEYPEITLELARRSETTYITVVEDILKKYPIILEGTVEEISARQEEQLLELAGWFRVHTYYLSGVYPETVVSISNLDSYSSKEEAIKLKARIDSGTFAVGVCMDYALLFEDASKLMGIDTMYISSRKADHAWNVVRLANGEIYHFDMTGIDQYEKMIFGWFDLTNGVYFTYGSALAYDQTKQVSSERLWSFQGGGFNVDTKVGKEKRLPAGVAYGTLEEWQSMYDSWNEKFPKRDNNPNH